MERLQLVRSEVNSGGAAVPKNIGLRISVGEYIFFLDSDDCITKTAFEDLYSAAQKFDADVVHCDKFFRTADGSANVNEEFLQEEKGHVVEIPEAETLLPENPVERLKMFSESKIGWTSCSNFIRRKFILKNNLAFPEMYVAEDFVFTIFLLCLAKNFLVTPKTFYIWRRTPESMTSAMLDVDKRFKRFVGSIFKGVAALDDFMSKTGILQDNPQFKYGIFELLTSTNLTLNTQLIPVYAQIPAFQLDFLIRRELAQVEDKTALAAFLFSRMNVFNVQLIHRQNLNFQYRAQLQQQQEQIQSLQEKIQHVKAYLRQLQNISQDLVDKMNTN